MERQGNTENIADVMILMNHMDIVCFEFVRCEISHNGICIPG